MSIRRDTPFSVHTNVFYFVLGMMAAFLCALTGSFWASVFGGFTGFMMMVMGVMSWHYHATYTLEDQLGDRKGMYLCFSALFGMSLFGALGSAPWVILVASFACGVILAYSARPGVRWSGSSMVIPPLVIGHLALLAAAGHLKQAGILFLCYLVIALWREIPEDRIWFWRSWDAYAVVRPGEYAPLSTIDIHDGAIEIHTAPAWAWRNYDFFHGVWHIGTAVIIFADILITAGVVASL